ncbi:hypothetical protein HQ447_10135 [bacterium]|nr:hypothetical protein [bacterium]
MPRRLISFLVLPSGAFAQEKATYDDHVLPIFQQACLNCHNPDKTKGGLDLSSFTAALKGSSGGKIVEPGDTASLLIASVRQTGDKKMPPEGDKLTDGQIEILQRWIAGGLLENKTSSARKPSKPKFETTLRSDPAAKPDGPPPMPAHLLLEPPVLTSRPAAIQALAASPWAPLLAVTGQRQVLLHHTQSLELLGILPFPEGDPISLTFTPDARYLIVGGGVPGKSGLTVTFDITTGARLLTVAKEFDSVLAADIRPGFDIVATGGPSRMLKIWNTETGELVRSIKKHTDWITALDLSADGVLLASGDRNGGVWVWESQTGAEFHTLRGHQAAITATVFRSDSNILATASEDGSVRFWEMNSGSEVRKIDAHPGGVTAFAFARDGRWVTAGRDGKAKFWKADFSAARDLAAKLPALATAVALDAEGDRAFVADAQGLIRVFQTSDAAPLGEIQANPPTIQVRLQSLAAEFGRQQTLVAAAEKAAVVASAARDGARQADPAALQAAEKTAAEATAARDQAQSQLIFLAASVRHWIAAAINSQALATRREADAAALAVDEQQLNFARAAADVAIQSTALSAKRSEYEKIANQLKNNEMPPNLSEEVNVTLAAVEIRLAEAAASYSKLENDLLSQRDAIESSAPQAHQKQHDAISLHTAYRQASE